MTPDELFTSCVPLAHKIARSFGRRYSWLADDFESDALLALWKSAQRYDVTLAKGMGFTKFAAYKLRHALTDRLRRERVKNPVAFLPQVPPGADGGITADPISLAYSRESTAAEVELNDLLSLFPPDRRDAMRRLSIGGETYAEVAAAQGVSAWTVRERMKADRERLREKLAG